MCGCESVAHSSHSRELIEIAISASWTVFLTSSGFRLSLAAVLIKVFYLEIELDGNVRSGTKAAAGGRAGRFGGRTRQHRYRDVRD